MVKPTPWEETQVKRDQQASGSPLTTTTTTTSTSQGPSPDPTRIPFRSTPNHTVAKLQHELTALII